MTLVLSKERTLRTDPRLVRHAYQLRRPLMLGAYWQLGLSVSVI